MNRTKINQKANREIKKLFEEKKVYGICEVHLSNCLGNMFLTYAHRHKRRWYYDKPDELLWDFKQVILLCVHCHEILEKDKQLTEQIFLQVRGEE